MRLNLKKPSLRSPDLFSRCAPLAAGLLLSCSALLLNGCLSRSLTAVQVSPASSAASAVAGGTIQFKAIGIYTESGHQTTSEDITSQVTWSSSDPTVATIASTGLATGVSAGTATITATTQGSFSELSASSTLTISAGSSAGGGTAGRILTAINVIPSAQTVTNPGEMVQFLAIGTYSAAPLTADITSQVNWVSSDPTVAQVSSSGLATANGYGETSITAVGTAADGSAITATGVLTNKAAATGGPALPLLTVYDVGSGTGAVTSSDGVINCASGTTSANTGCSMDYTSGAVVTLIATPSGTSTFGGWTNNCITTSSKAPYTCQVTMSANENVGAIFNP